MTLDQDLVNALEEDYRSAPITEQDFKSLEKEWLGATRLWPETKLEGEEPDEVVSAERGIVQVNASDMSTPLGFKGRSYEGRFSGSRRRFDHEGLLKVLDDRVTRASISRHRIDLNA